MPIVSQKTLTPYTGVFSSIELKHLLRRTLFGIDKNTLSYFQSKTLTQVVDELLMTSPEPAPPLNNYQNQTNDPEVPYGQTWIHAVNSSTIDFARRNSFKAWLMMNQLNESKSITEKMTLFLHSILPVDIDSIGAARFAYSNYKMLRENSLGNYKTIIKKTTIDLAMLRYLNGYVNEKKSPDENYARELQELFTLGKNFTPIYSESDIKNAAKVLTGYQIDFTTSSYKFNSSRHDTTNKTFSSFYNNTIITGKTGVDGEKETDELIEMIFSKQQEIAKQFCRKLYSFFIYYDIDATVETNIISPLAQLFINSNWEIKPVISALLKSEHFFDADTYGSHIKSPVDFICGCVKEMGVQFPSNSNIELQYKIYLEISNYLVVLRQSPYSPPSVSGWEAYYQVPLMHENWITTDTIGKRNLITTALILGFKKNGFEIKGDILKYTESLPNPQDPNVLIVDVLDLLHTIPPSQELKDYLKSVLLYGLSQDYEWTTIWNDYIANKTDAAKKEMANSRLFIFYKHILELAEYQLM